MSDNHIQLSASDVDLLTGDDEPMTSEKQPSAIVEEMQPDAKVEATTQTTEVTIESEGTHKPTDLSRNPTSLLIETDEAEAEASTELRTILSQEYPPTPGASSTHSRRQSFSFTKKPTPEPDLPFDFSRFQEQLRSKSAEPIAKYLKSFLHEFSKRQWNNTEQHKIIQDFLEFIRGKMLVYEPFKSASSTEFDNAQEGMEKLVMNRLYPDLFPPLIVGKVGKTATHRMGHGEDLDRDRLLADKIRIYSWVREEHLDLSHGPMNDRFLGLAGIEISKLDQYRAPRDKIICILNCCKVIFGLLRNAGSDESADKFVPLLILTLLRANTSNLCSHVSYIQRFRNPDKLFGEAGYYLSSLCGAMNFIEALDRKSLTITDEEYDKAVEEAIKRIKLEDSVVPPSPATPITPNKSGLQLPSKDLVFEKATGLLNIAKPSLSSIGRLFSHEENDRDISTQDIRPRRSLEEANRLDRSYVESGAFGGNDSGTTTPRLPVVLIPPRVHFRLPCLHQCTDKRPSLLPPPTRIEISAAEAEAAKQKERKDTLATLSAMFENVEIGVIEMVLDEKRGKVGACIDALLEIGS
ncbi:hypothetical protein MRB53_040532 [Persea americana]|nr:hypothetical protein MRB53_040532 [Persea americana]